MTNNTEKLKLSQKITNRRTDRLDEWSMDELSRDVSKLESEIAELTKERDELKQELTTIKSMANICSGEIDELELTMHQICTIASEALSTQGDSDG